jgi:hypothetical protein
MLEPLSDEFACKFLWRAGENVTKYDIGRPFPHIYNRDGFFCTRSTKGAVQHRQSLRTASDLKAPLFDTRLLLIRP